MPFVKGAKHSASALKKMEEKRDAWLAEHKGERRRPVCPTCGFAEKVAGSSYCSDCNKKRRRRHWLKRAYGMSLQEFAALEEDAGGRCAICATANDIVVDHDHETGKVRGLLCRVCNSAIGGLGDDPARLRRAFVYLTTSGSTNTALSDVGGLVTLLIRKGLITEEEYADAIADAMEREAAGYEARLRRRFGARVTLGEAGFGADPE